MWIHLTRHFPKDGRGFYPKGIKCYDVCGCICDKDFRPGIVSRYRCSNFLKAIIPAESARRESLSSDDSGPEPDIAAAISPENRKCCSRQYPPGERSTRQAPTGNRRPSLPGNEVCHSIATGVHISSIQSCLCRNGSFVYRAEHAQNWLLEEFFV